MFWGNIYGLCGMPYEYILKFPWYVFSVHYQDINFQPTLSSRCLSWFITKWMRDFWFSIVMFNFSNHLPSLLSSSLTILPHPSSFLHLSPLHKALVSPFPVSDLCSSITESALPMLSLVLPPLWAAVEQTQGVWGYNSLLVYILDTKCHLLFFGHNNILSNH